MDAIEQMRADWNLRATDDAFYYVAFAQRGQSFDDFLSSAAETIQSFESELIRLPPGELRSRRALEVGCGPGRLMLPMSRLFGEIHGVDISDEMVKLATHALAQIPHAHVHLTPDSDLKMFASNSFDYVYSYAVFQHIPSRAVVLTYLCEIQRVLKPGGVLCCQLRGAPPLDSDVSKESATWTGCFFTWEDVRAFVRANQLQLVAVSGLNTQYMLVTVRKPAPGIDSSLCRSEPILRAVTPAVGTGTTVPQRGRAAAVSLWMSGMPRDAGLLDLQIYFDSIAADPCYISPPAGDDGCQVNVLLPAGTPLGTVQTSAEFRGKRLSPPFPIEIVEAPDLAPEIRSFSDGVDLVSQIIHSGGMKVVIENVVSPDRVHFLVGGQPVSDLQFACVDPIAAQYHFAFSLPGSITLGRQTLTVVAGDFPLPPVAIEIRAKSA